MTTLTEIQNLTDEELRIRVAEFDGWRRAGDSENDGWIRGTDGDDADICWVLSNYPKDLNAVHEVEKKLEWDEIDDWSNAAVYIDNLCKITESDYYSLLKPRVVRATARQRCEALLLTLDRSNPDSCQADKKVVAKSD